MQFIVEEVCSESHPWAIRNTSGNRHANVFFQAESEAQIFANAMNEAWGKMERKSFTRAVDAAKAATNVAYKSW